MKRNSSPAALFFCAKKTPDIYKILNAGPAKKAGIKPCPRNKMYKQKGKGVFE